MTLRDLKGCYGVDAVSRRVPVILACDLRTPILDTIVTGSV